MVAMKEDMGTRSYMCILNNGLGNAVGLEEGGGPNRQPHPERYYSRINQAEVRTALQKMGRNKAVGPDQIPIEAWRSLGDEGDAQVCSNYRGIKLLGHTMKLWERVIERRLRRETSMTENQFGFMPGRSSVEAIHLIRSLIEKYKERQRDMHMAFLDLEKAYDSVPRELIWKTLVYKGTSRRYIKVIRDMYDGAKTYVRTSIGNTEFFPVDVGLHQGSTISPYLFALILDGLSRGIQEDIPRCLIFADDIVLVAESVKGLNIKLKNWREVLEDNDLRVSREKTEYLRCDFGDGEITHNEEVDIRIGDKILQPKESSRYLGSMLHKSGRIDEDTLLNMIPNGVYRAQLKVETIINKTREGRLRWFGHVRRRPQPTPVRRVEDLVVDGLRRRGRPKLRWVDKIKQDMKELLLYEDMTSDRNEWKARIRIDG
ncbi:retrovirus-related pol polyprotein LINE-1 [Tanacetum coccineum]